MCWVTLGFFAAVLVLLALKDDTRQALFLAPGWFLLLGLAYTMMVNRRGTIHLS